jgi:hypothetical protein
MDEQRPRALEVYVGSFAGSSYGVWWDGSRLVYESFLSGYEERRQVVLVPSPAQWRRFWQTIDRIDVWAWDRRYEPSERFEPAKQVRDGTHWSLTLARGERSVQSSGDSRGPGSADLDDSGPFGEFAEAVSRLVGGRPFG